MSRFPQLVLVSLATCFLLGLASAEEKKAQTIKGWGTVVDPDGDCQLKEDKGAVTLTVPKTYHDLTYTDDSTKLNAPRILQEVAGDFQLQVKVAAYPLPTANTSSSGRHSFVSTGLLIWHDDRNFIRMDRASEGSAPAVFVWVEQFQDGKSMTQRPHRVENKDTFLRAARRGNKLTFEVSEDGSAWTEVQTLAVELPKKVKAGVLAINTTTNEFSPRLEGLKLSQ